MRSWPKIMAMILATVAILATAGVALADPPPGWSTPHKGLNFGNTPEGCASCHRAHAGQDSYLLRMDQEDLCFSCHGAPGAMTLVEEGVLNGTGEGLRGGGFEEASMVTWAPVSTTVVANGANGGYDHPGAPQVVDSSHKGADGVWGGTAWGFGPAANPAYAGKANLTLECATCHNPHGNGNYRMLRPKPVGGYNDNNATSVVISDDISTDVSRYIALYRIVTNTTTPVDGWYKDWGYASNLFSKVPINGVLTNVVTSTVLTGGVQEARTMPVMSAWCGQCHSRHEAPGGSYRTDSTDAIFKYRHNTSWSGSALRGTNYEGATGSRTCMTCHVSHGTAATMGGDAADASWQGIGGTTGPSGSRLLTTNNRGVCRQCHSPTSN